MFYSIIMNIDEDIIEQLLLFISSIHSLNKKFNLLISQQDEKVMII